MIDNLSATYLDEAHTATIAYYRLAPLASAGGPNGVCAFGAATGGAIDET